MKCLYRKLLTSDLTEVRSNVHRTYITLYYLFCIIIKPSLLLPQVSRGSYQTESVGFLSFVSLHKTISWNQSISPSIIIVLEMVYFGVGGGGMTEV